MFLGIGSHTIVERFSRMLDRRAVNEESLIEAVDLCDQVRGVGIAAGHRFEGLVVLGLVTTQQQHVVDVKELQVDEFVFDVLRRGSTADDMRDDHHAIVLLYGSRDGDGTRAAADALPLKVSAFELTIDIFAVVGGDIDIQRLHLAHLVEIAEQRSRAVSLQGRQHLYGEAVGAAVVVKNIYDVHILSEIAGVSIFLATKITKKKRISK